jgi:hypothetical protein
MKSPILLRPRNPAKSSLRHRGLETRDVQQADSIDTAADPIIVDGDVDDGAHDPASPVDTNSECNDDLQVLEGLGYETPTPMQPDRGEQRRPGGM